MLSPHPKEQKKARLLCVDDDLHFLMGFTAVLQSAGYSVVATNDPRQAFELATNAPFDLVVVDYDMPMRLNALFLARKNIFIYHP